MENSTSRCWRTFHSEIQRELLIRAGDDGVHISPEIGKGLILLVLIVTSYLSILAMQPSPLWFLAWVLLGIFTFFLIVNCAHDASHRVLFKSGLLNSVGLTLPFALLGIDGILWGLRHRGAHHPHTNVSGEDTDSIPNVFLRLSPHHPWRPHFRYQHVYAPILYACALPHTAFVQDFEHLIFRPLPYLRKIHSLRAAWARLVCIKLFYLGVFIAIPVYALHHSLASVLLGILCQQIAASLVFVFTICLNHYVCETTFFEERPASPHLEHQLGASADWYATNRFCCWLMGGANAHTAHHLFPAVAHRHYWWISARLYQFCQEHSLSYHSFTFMQGMRSHFRFLKNLGRRPL